MTRHPLHLILIMLLLLGSAAIHAADQDTTLRLNQHIEGNANAQEQELLQGELDDQPTITLNGETLAIGNNANDLGRALYLSLSHQQWQAASAFLLRYRGLPNADPMLLHYADGVLQRVRGQLGNAETQFRALLQRQPDFLPGKLELARVLFENQQDQAAETLFRQIRAGLPADDAHTLGVRTSVERFLAALDQRQDWQGSINLGPTWVDNLNQSSESNTCLLATNGGTCIVRRTLPEAISATGLDYEATLNRRVALSGHHGLYARALLYGYSYRNYSEYNESTLIANLGYSYRSARNQYSLAPSFETNRIGNDGMYSAWGARAEWLHQLSRRSAVKLEATYRDMRYQDPLYRYNNGGNSALYATGWHVVSPRWTLFGGLDLSERRTEEPVYGYQQGGARLGAALTLQSGIRASLFSSFRHREYAEYSPLLGARRRDGETNHTLIVSLPGLAWQGITPSLSLKHTEVRSSVDWLYSYQRTQTSLRLEKLF
ncbi:surface lipoprotein assembly modifier [Halopseudomonas pelagia]|uniref:surface lipoprotein assembly modifier n=1 Tax=Halopseudomonas pelagia TaxID=553151 RepID=UPI0030D78C27|tara:strand:+ start:11210 stop:12679 length:1470 start_codon:yes stop_codon:yes gene_type:complete